MRLNKFNRPGRVPLRTVSEIADILGISKQKLTRGLMDESAPIGIPAKSLGHKYAGANRVWYEPKEVIR